MIEWARQLREGLVPLLGDVELGELRLLPGGASKEAWSVDVRTAHGGMPLLVRRDAADAVEPGAGAAACPGSLNQGASECHFQS